MKPITTGDVREMVALFQAGRSVAIIARRLGRCPSSVRNHLRRVGVDTKRADRVPGEGRRFITAEEDAQMVELYASGLSLLDVADRTKRAYTTVRRRLLAAGVKLRAPYDTLRQAQAAALRVTPATVYDLRFAQGRSWREVCAALGMKDHRRHDLRIMAVEYAAANGLPIVSGRELRTRRESSRVSRMSGLWAAK